MGEVDKKYMPFWKWWIHKSESSPTLTHKTTARTTKTTSRTVSRPAVAKTRHIISSEDLYERKRPIRKELKSTEEHFLRSLEEGHGVRSSEDLLETKDEDMTMSLERHRRAVSTSRLPARPSSLEQTVIESLTSRQTQESKSASSLELKGSRWLYQETPDEDTHTKSKKSGAGSKRRLTLPLSRSKKSSETKTKKKERWGSKSSKITNVDAGPSPSTYDTVDNSSFIQQSSLDRRHFNFGANMHHLDKGKLSSPGYEILTPTEIYEKRSTLANTTKEGERQEFPSSQRSVNGQSETSGSERDNSTLKVETAGATKEAGESRAATRQDIAVEKTGTQESEDGSSKGTQVGISSSELNSIQFLANEALLEGTTSRKTEGMDVSNSYDVLGPPRPIYEAPPPPRRVEVSPIPPQDTGVAVQTLTQQREVHGQEEAPRTPSTKGFPERPLPTPPSSGDNNLSEAKLSPLDQNTMPSDTSNVHHSDVHRTQSEQPPTPKVVKKHQAVRRTKSEPRMKRSEFHPLNLALTTTETEAMQSVLDDHLFKHNLKVMTEAGVDAEELQHKLAIKKDSNASTTSSVSYQQVSPVSGFSQESHDPRTKLSYDPQFSGSRSSSFR